MAAIGGAGGETSSGKAVEQWRIGGVSFTNCAISCNLAALSETWSEKSTRTWSYSKTIFDGEE